MHYLDSSGYKNILIGLIISLNGYQADNPVCSDVMNFKIKECMGGYNTMIDMLLPVGKFFTGVDGENIRRICESLEYSLRCVIEISNNCNESTQIMIEENINYSANVLNLCYITDFYEVYARYRYCYEEKKSESMKCERFYSNSVDPIIDRVQNGDSDALSHMCSYFNTFLRCVMAKIKQCSDGEALTLVEPLLMSSAPLVAHCPKIEFSSTTLMVTSSTQHIINSHQQIDFSKSRAEFYHTNSYILVFLYVISIILISSFR